MHEGVTEVRPHPQCHCDRSSLASPFTASDQSHGGPLRRLLPWGRAPVSLQPGDKQWGKTFPPLSLWFHHSLWLWNLGLGGRLGGVGETSPSWHWDLCCPMSTTDVPPRSSWLFCHHYYEGLGKVRVSWFQINLGLLSIISSDALALRLNVSINYW